MKSKWGNSSQWGETEWIYRRGVEKQERIVWNVKEVQVERTTIKMMNDV